MIEIWLHEWLEETLPKYSLIGCSMLMRLRDNFGSWNQSSCSSALSHALIALAFYSDSRWLSGDVRMMIIMRHSIAAILWG